MSAPSLDSADGTMFDYWCRVYADASRKEFDRNSYDARAQHEAGLKAVIEGVAKSVQDAERFSRDFDLNQATSKVF